MYNKLCESIYSDSARVGVDNKVDNALDNNKAGEHL